MTASDREREFDELVWPQLRPTVEQICAGFVGSLGLPPPTPGDRAVAAAGWHGDLRAEYVAHLGAKPEDPASWDWCMRDVLKHAARRQREWRAVVWPRIRPLLLRDGTGGPTAGTGVDGWFPVLEDVYRSWRALECCDPATYLARLCAIPQNFRRRSREFEATVWDWVRGPVRSLCWGFQGSVGPILAADTDDLVQECHVKLWRVYAGRLDVDGSSRERCGPFLRAVARNHLISLYQTARHRAEHLPEAPLDEVVEPAGADTTSPLITRLAALFLAARYRARLGPGPTGGGCLGAAAPDPGGNLDARVTAVFLVIGEIQAEATQVLLDPSASQSAQGGARRELEGVTAFLLREYFGLENQQVARILGVSGPTAHHRYYRDGLALIKERLQGREPPPEEATATAPVEATQPDEATAGSPRGDEA